MSKLQTLRDMPDLKGKKVIIRVDFNVPVGDDGAIKNDARIRFALPTLNTLLQRGAAQLILMTHVGRPKGAEPKLRTDVEAARLGELIGEKVAKVNDWGETGLPKDKIVMLENLRFHPGEKSKVDAELDAFGKQLASLADFYVNEAFSNSHRKHASMTWVPKNIPGFAGLGVEKEAQSIGPALDAPARPVVALIAGAKADKLAAVGNMMKLADHVLIGGALAYALRGAQGFNIGSSLVDKEGMDEMGALIEAIKTSEKVMLPDDAVVADGFSADAKHKVVPVNGIEDGWMALDIGPETARRYAALIKEAKTVLWFGPMGVSEWKAFEAGTRAVAEAIAANRGTTILGGGDTATAAEKFGISDKVTHVSTGGGASLAMIEGKPLPALEILKR